MQLQVTNSPFSQEQVELLNRLLPTLTESQHVWLSGYLSAYFRAAESVPAGTALQVVSAPPAAPAASPVPEVSISAASREVTVLFGSQTGNSQRLAGSLAAVATAALAEVDVVRVHDVAETRQFLDVFAAIRGAA